jgi:hypothetical protein
LPIRQALRRQDGQRLGAGGAHGDPASFTWTAGAHAYALLSVEGAKPSNRSAKGRYQTKCPGHKRYL